MRSLAPLSVVTSSLSFHHHHLALNRLRIVFETGYFSASTRAGALHMLRISGIRASPVYHVTQVLESAKALGL
jgi:hypothetical protein